MFPQRDFQDDFPEDSSCEGFNRQVSLLHCSFSSVSPGDSLPRTSFFSNYCLTAPAGSTFTDCEEVGEQCFVFFFTAAVVQSKRPAACIHFPLACSCNYLNVWTVEEMSDDTPRCECFTPVLCCSCAGQTQQSPSVGLESVFLSSSSHWY